MAPTQQPSGNPAQLLRELLSLADRLSAAPPFPEHMASPSAAVMADKIAGWAAVTLARLEREPSRPAREDDDRRERPRYTVDIPAWVRTATGIFSARICDLSVNSAGIRLSRMFEELPSQFELQSREFGILPVSLVWRREDRAGLRFRFTGQPPPDLQAAVNRLEIC